MGWQVGTLSSSHPSFALSVFFLSFSTLAGCALCQVCHCVRASPIFLPEMPALCFLAHTPTLARQKGADCGRTHTLSSPRHTHLDTRAKKRRIMLVPWIFFLWAGAGPPEGVHAGGRWVPTARRRRRFFQIFFFFFAIFTCFHGNSAYLRPCYHALRQPVGAADRAMMHN